MSVIVDHTLLPTLKQYGAFDIGACFNCGNCTAVCPLSEGDATFPRKIIRYAQVGMRESLLSSKELWTCYACGECSETCPRQAEPERVHGRCPALRHRRATTGPASPGRCTRGPSWAP